MEYNSYLPGYTDDDVLMFQQETMFKVVKFRQAIEYAFNKYLPAHLQSSLANNKIIINTQNCFGDGVTCEVLKIGAKGGWKKGKVRIRVSLEFCPDEPEVEEIIESNQIEFSKTESPLDDIRQIINGNS